MVEISLIMLETDSIGIGDMFVLVRWGFVFGKALGIEKAET